MHGASPYHHHPGPDQRDKEREQRLQEARARPGEGRGNTATETTMRHSQQAADGSAVSTVTKTERLVHSSKAWGIGWGCVLPTPELCASHTLLPIPLLFPTTLTPADDGTRTARTTTVESSFVRRSESKAAWHGPVCAYSLTSSGLLQALSLGVCSCTSVTFSSLPVAVTIPPSSDAQVGPSPYYLSPLTQMAVAALWCKPRPSLPPPPPPRRWAGEHADSCSQMSHLCLCHRGPSLHAYPFCRGVD